MPLSPGQTLNNRYRIVKLLGQGGFGAVYRAWDINLERPRALKENLDVSMEAQRQFKREAQILSDLTHPNLPKVIDHFVVPGQGQYLVMEYVEGQDLQEMLDSRGGPLPEAQVMEWAGQVCDALSYLHVQNPPVIHRDIKPANIKITPQGKATLVDFGIAKVSDPSLRTTMGARAVTPGYSPPEQYGLGSTSPQSDIYSLGATLYALLTGVVPPASVDIVSGNALPPAPVHTLNPRVSPGAGAAIEKAMQLNRLARFENAEEFKTALKQAPPMVRIQSPASHPPQVQTMPALQPSALPVEAPRASLPRSSSLWKWIGAFVLMLLLAIPASFLIYTWLSQGSVFSLAKATRIPETATETSQVDAILSGGVKMKLIPGGEFWMGSPETDSEAKSDEKPQHGVYLDDFFIDVYEVTNAHFEVFILESGYQTTAEREGGAETYAGGSWGFVKGADWRHPRGSSSNIAGLGSHPVVLVSWEDAAAYCEWRGARLPTEAEWEKAARGGLKSSRYPWGDENADCNRTNFWGMQGACIGNTSQAGVYAANGYGLFDMAGNVWEWVQDWYQADYYASRVTWNNPSGPASGTARVVRGGSWYQAARDVRVALRYAYAPTDRRVYVGFRCALTP